MADDSKHAPAQWRSSPPFYQHLGLELDALADGRSSIRMPFQKHFGNTRGEMHGGAVAALVDAAMSQAVRSTIPLGSSVATITMTLNYMAPAFGELTCKGTVVRGGKSVAFAEAEVTDEKGNAVCRGSATFRLMLPKKEGETRK
jgi:uncharacterized protein (TIGR00369 family)